MFAGTSNVKIYGGNFREIHGSYNHYEYSTTVANHNSNNVTGNTLTETYNDNSQEYHGVNAKGRAYVRALRREVEAGSTEPDCLARGLPQISSEQRSTGPPHHSPEVVPAATEPIPLAQSFPISTTIPHIPPGPYSNVSYMSYSAAWGDIIPIMPSKATAHFMTVFKSMDDDDDESKDAHMDAQPGVDTLPDSLSNSRQNPIHIDNNEHHSIALHAALPDDAQQNLPSEGLHTTQPSSPPVLIAPPHQFSSQKLNPTSGYSHLAHNVRDIVADAITRTHSDIGSTLSTSSGSALESNTEYDHLPNTDLPMSNINSSHRVISGTSSLPISLTATTSPNNLLALKRVAFNSSYTEINHNHHTVNYPGSGNISNNTIQTLYDTPTDSKRPKNRVVIENRLLNKVEEAPQRRLRRSKKPSRRTQ